MLSIGTTGWATPCLRSQFIDSLSQVQLAPSGYAKSRNQDISASAISHSFVPRFFHPDNFFIKHIDL